MMTEQANINFCWLSPNLESRSKWGAGFEIDKNYSCHNLLLNFSPCMLKMVFSDEKNFGYVKV